MPSDFASVTPDIFDELAAMLGSQAVSADASQRDQRARDVSGHAPHRVDVIVWQQTA